jgi:hypothetical protein
MVLLGIYLDLYHFINLVFIYSNLLIYASSKFEGLYHISFFLHITSSSSLYLLFFLSGHHLAAIIPGIILTLVVGLIVAGGLIFSYKTVS